jgi:ribosomal protein S18 acetylase RimI-like enzyme
LEDGPALMRIDRATWTVATSPSPAPPDGAPFFGTRTSPADVLVAEVDGVVAGYISIRPATELQASRHVQHVNGLAVDPALQGRGVGRALVQAAAAEAEGRGARRLTLRVLGPNVVARRLYETCGFVVEGVLRGEFHLDGKDVDDVLMARTL